ncbi:hypothetical protein LAZ67_5002259 [Cordylochernes scorpioides]|uniref:Integrase catalytic domain-containing protein n=1 Tax=Cordylochernes scorpioides TaxID=51811 RepID=A0ABY6KG77_9ARAC|nr:hypothetical protein LAZ67_5002259 [Cordylochernes scorpioides]
MASLPSHDVTLDKLDGYNYSLWSFKTEMLLQKEDLWEVVTENIPDEPKIEWKRKDSKARAIINLSIADSQIVHEECWHYQKRNNSNKEYKYENFRRGNVPKYTNQSSVTQEQPTNQRTTKGPNPKALNCTQREASVHNWFVDSGATSHMAYDESFFTELNREQTQNVVVSNGNKLQVKGIGQGEIKVITPQGKTDTLLLTKVLYIPELTDNLLSMSAVHYQLTLSALTVPYSPAQNGVAERKNRSLMEMTRCMLFDSGLPQSLWAEAVTTANYLHNRIPSKATDKTPFELWTNRKPSLKHLKRFGCKAFAYIPKIKRNKLDSKVIEGIFLGYDDRSKGYRILHDTDNITISRSVKFLDKENGFHHASTKPTSPQVLSTDLTSSNHIGNEEESQEPGTQSENLEDSETEYDIQPRTSTGTQVLLGSPTITKNRKRKIATQAMNEVLNSLEKNNVWELTPLPKDKKIIGCKWTYKQKLNSKGEIERYKARLVAKGFNQKFGRDYEETFAPIVKHSTIRAFLAASVYKGMQIKELYMELPEGLYTKHTNEVCQLKKAIYSLKQAGRSWNTKIASTLIKNNFKQSIVDPCLFTKNEENHSIYLILYVDDMLLASDSEIIIQNTVKTLEKEFEIKNLGNPTQFIGIEISRNREGELLLSQKNKIQELVERYNLQEAKPTFTPMESGYPGISDVKLLPNNVQYQQLIGSLFYLSVVSRPDIAAPVCILSSRNQNPRNCDWNAAKRIVRYLKTTKELELRISNQKPPTLEAYSDATWASDNTDRKSLSGNLFQLRSNPISWMTGKQGCVSLSSTEAELISAAEASQELLWLLDLLKDLELEQKSPIYFHQDNQSCLKICSSEKVSTRTKHIATKIHHLKDLQKKTVIKMIYCPTGDTKADILTKPLPRPTFEKLRNNLVTSPHSCRNPVDLVVMKSCCRLICDEILSTLAIAVVTGGQTCSSREGQSGRGKFSSTSLHFGRPLTVFTESGCRGRGRVESLGMSTHTKRRDTAVEGKFHEQIGVELSKMEVQAVVVEAEWKVWECPHTQNEETAVVGKFHEQIGEGAMLGCTLYVLVYLCSIRTTVTAEAAVMLPGEIQSFVDAHNRLRSNIYPTASNMKALSWVKLFELHVTDEDKGKLFFYYLEERALEWYTDEIAGTNINQWVTIKQKFITRFGSSTATPLIDAHRRYLRRDESVNDYFQSKIRLLKQTSLSKVEQIQMLTEGLPAQWKISLAPIHFEDIETWVSATLKLEAAVSSILKNSKPAFSYNKLKDPTSYVASPPKPPYPCRFCKMRNLNNFHWHNECPYRPKTFPKETAANEQPSNLYATSDPSSSNSTDLPTVEDLKKKGLVRDSRRPWAFPVTLVPKADGQKRLCVDYRRLNALTIDDKMPLPNIQEVIDRLQGAKYFTRWTSLQVIGMSKWLQTAQRRQHLSPTKGFMSVLAMYDPTLPCKLYTDASEQGLGAILAQKHPDGRERVVSYFSKRLNPTQSRYTASELECFAIIEAVRHFNNYLDKPFQIATDHSALKWLLNHKNPGGRLFRWSMELSSRSFTIIHRAEGQQTHVDAFARNPVSTFITEDKMKIAQQQVDLRFVKNPQIKTNSQTNRQSAITKFPDSDLQPFDLIGLDTIVLGNETKNTRHKYLQVIIDHHSRYIWASPTASNNSAAILNILRQLLSSGVPIKRILTDNGSNFTSRSFINFLSENKIAHSLATPYHPQTCGMVEKVNHTLLTRLRVAILEKPKQKWSTLVPFIVKTYSQTPHEVTKFSPKFLLYGIDESPSFADHPITLEEARGLARENTRKAQIKRKNHHDDKHPDVEFSEGDQVLRTVAKHHPYMSKLSPRQQGPFFVKKKISSLVYDIQDTEGRVYRAHASQLRSFKDRESLGAGGCDGVLTHRQF